MKSSNDSVAKLDLSRAFADSRRQPDQGSPILGSLLSVGLDMAVGSGERHPRRAVPAPRVTTARCSAPPHSWHEAGARMFSAPGSWLSQLPGAAGVAAGYELLYRLGKDYEKPEFGIDAVDVDGVTRRRCVEQTDADEAVLPAAALQALQRRRRRHRRS